MNSTYTPHSQITLFIQTGICNLEICPLLPLLLLVLLLPLLLLLLLVDI